MTGFDEYLKKIFYSAVESADPYAIIKRMVRLNDSILNIDSGEINLSYNLAEYNRILVVGAGKATAKMALAIENILGNRITQGIISVKFGHTETLSRVKMIQAAHPIPDKNSLFAADQIMNLLKDADENTLIISLISGGGSALLSQPLKFDNLQITLADKQLVTGLLLACGATINEINCIRKHISNIKGGRLAAIAYPAEVVNLMLSDVIGDDRSSIASGLFTADESTYADMATIISRYNLFNQLPASIQKVLELAKAGLLPETAKKGEKCFNKVHDIIIGKNYTSLDAASKKAVSLNLNPLILTSQLSGEAKEAAKFLMAVAKDIKKYGKLGTKPVCLLTGGETTVTIIGNGIGGRNQEMALSFLAEIEKDPENTQGIYFLSGATDGNDGPTDAAGCFASWDLLQIAKKLQLDITGSLKNNDSYNSLNKIGALFKTGPTNTNVCDIQIVIIV